MNDAMKDAKWTNHKRFKRKRMMNYIADGAFYYAIKLIHTDEDYEFFFFLKRWFGA